MRVLYLVPARSGSKGLSNKNLQLVGGISLVGRALLTAWQALALHQEIDGTVSVDTDSEAIAEEGRAFGGEVPFLRPSHLAEDATPTIDNCLWTLDRWLDRDRSFDAVVLLQPTSAARTADDVEQCWGAFDRHVRPSVMSICRTEHPLEIALRLSGEGLIDWARHPDSDLRSQAFPPSFWPTGSVYINSPESLRQHRAFIVPGHTSGVEISRLRSVDIDSRDDLEIADAVVRARKSSCVRIGQHEIGPGPFVIGQVEPADATTVTLDQISSRAQLDGVVTPARPVIVRVGPERLDAVARAVGMLTARGAAVVLAIDRNDPAAPMDAAAIAMLQGQFGVPVGWFDR